MAVDTQPLPVVLCPEESGNVPVRDDVVEHSGRLHLAGIAHWVPDQEGMPEPSEPGVTGPEPPALGLLGAAAVDGTEAIANSIPRAVRVAAFLVCSSGHDGLSKGIADGAHTPCWLIHPGAPIW